MAEGSPTGRGVPAGAEGSAGGISGGRHSRGWLRRGVAGSEKLERRCHPRQGHGPAGNPPGLAGGRWGRSKPLHRGGHRRVSDCQHLCAQWQPGARAEAGLQATVVRAACRACEIPAGAECPGGVGGRLQRHADGTRRLQSQGVGGGRVVPAGGASGFSRSRGPRVGRCASGAASRRAALLVLEIPPQCLAAGCRLAHRPFPAQPATISTAGGGRSGP